ncbi:hypothetical protein [Microbacterium hydrocarbonoxydans]|uniref:hypothetical protein n=1 Tax=Microbacterium hydrocarbonoxydans TaxID=273678 RepID=UPI00203F6D02|nr:hypothetical protein [Microbacterium hydrocarbonoxydans]MCM3778176.1 hypothetical protein [Microbacterium hydrocarbonoxydans]
MVMVDPFGDPATATPDVTTVYPPPTARTLRVVVVEIVATPDGPTTDDATASPRSSNVVQDQSVSADVFVPTVRPTRHTRTAS